MDTRLDEAHGTVTADPVFLPRVLTNLLDNAARPRMEPRALTSR